MEIWGGIECTINRVGDQYFDQLIYQGHYTRKQDLELISGLGIKKIRYPLLWEKHEPQKTGLIDWGFTENQLNTLKAQNVDVIAGLVHHGSGPDYVNMLEDSFPEGLAAYAEKLATKFPWINYYTPINEPLTTARFCGLYGLWYPHKSDDVSFIRILYNECKATALAMQAIRTINPAAKLIHTEDLGKTHSAPTLQYQADFENERRWIGLDLLCGRVTHDHFLYDYLVSNGITPEELMYFIKNPCPPDILGFNYYITSERYLDNDLTIYPIHTHGSNSKHAYADIEAVRSAAASLVGPKQLLKEAWDRYRLPLAITEAHLHCGREDQLRWLEYVLNDARELAGEGVDFRGVTIWSLLGAYGWDSLLTKEEMNYESGVFDVRSGTPRATAIAKMVTALAHGKDYQHPVLSQKGWWLRPDRILYPTIGPANRVQPFGKPPILLIGSSGTLGKAFARICNSRNLNFVALDTSQLNCSIIEQVNSAINKFKPWAVINASGFLRIEDAERDEKSSFLSNIVGPVNLARCCRKYGIKLLTFSSDQVFDGKKNAEYIEHDEVNPLNLFGRSKAKAEERVLYENPESLIIRISEVFSPWSADGFMTRIITALSNRKTIDVANDVFVSPTLVTDLINSSLDLLIDEERNIWHLANQGTISWADLAQEVASRGRYNPSLLVQKPYAELNLNAIRPSYSGLTSNRGIFLPTLDNALERYFHELRAY